METAINTRMASRVSKIDFPTYDQLVTIEADDIPISAKEAERISSEGFDDEAIDKALKRLDSLVGLNKVKSAIHNFVNISRFLHSQGERFRGKGLLKWNFAGNTGTGKSTVAHKHQPRTQDTSDTDHGSFEENPQRQGGFRQVF